jgi:hypothetical protein
MSRHYDSRITKDRKVVSASDLYLADIEIRAGMEIEIRTGMGKGLPLAKPSQAGPIMKGSNFQPFGNWTGTAMTLELVLVATTGPDGRPVAISFDWQSRQG